MNGTRRKRAVPGATHLATPSTGPAPVSDVPSAYRGYGATNGLEMLWTIEARHGPFSP